MKRLMFAALLLSIGFAMATETICAQELRPGGQVPDFTVQDMRGHSVNYRARKRHVTVVMFFSTRCPISNAFNYRRNMIYRDYKDRVEFIVVDSNSNEPLEEVRAYASQVGFDFPVYKDVGNVVADRFGVLTTTDTFVMDSSGVMQYHGYVEDSPVAARSTKQGLRLAIEAVLEGRPVEMAETKARGCAIRRVQP